MLTQADRNSPKLEGLKCESKQGYRKSAEKIRRLMRKFYTGFTKTERYWTQYSIIYTIGYGICHGIAGRQNNA